MCSGNSFAERLSKLGIEIGGVVSIALPLSGIRSRTYPSAFTVKILSEGTIWSGPKIKNNNLENYFVKWYTTI